MARLRVALAAAARTVLAAGGSACSADRAGPGGKVPPLLPPGPGTVARGLPGCSVATAAACALGTAAISLEPVRVASTYAAGVEIRTGYGLARAELDEPASPAFLLVLTHGASGGVDTPDLLAVRDAAVQLGGVVARVVQPYRLRGARAPGSAARQDVAWLKIISVLRARYAGLPLVQGGRSNGARVTCRTARAAGALAVLALAFPLHPPGRPERSRAAELREAGTAVLAVSGDRDAFGVPGSADAGQVVVLPGETHALSRNPAALGDAVRAWLPEVLALPRPAR